VEARGTDSTLSRLADRLRASRFARFLAVGLVNTAVGYALYAVIYLILRAPIAALLLATAGGIVFNFFTTGRLVFANRRGGAFPAFVLGYAVTVSLNVAILKLLIGVGLRPLVAQALALAVVVPLSFGINAVFVFARRV
jgi:putative flippase GtrA